MREHGWYGSERERRRQRHKMREEMRKQKTRRRQEEWGQIGRTLELLDDWWAEDQNAPNPFDDAATSDSEDSDSDDEDPTPYTPPHDYDSMLVFSLSNLPQLLDSLVVNVRPVVRPMARRAAPANGLYYLARFACVWCDHTWFEEVIVGSVDKIEETVHVSSNCIPHS